MTEDLFEELLEEGEGERVDFKEFNYDFFNSDKKVKDEARVSFIKDIFSFANTPKPYKKSAYIVLGVKDNGELVGLKSSIDGNIFQQKLELKSLGKIPRIHYHKDFPYREKIFGIIEIFPPESEKEPYISESDFTDKIKKGVLYFRRDNKNSEADEIETNNIKRWFYQCYERYEKNIQIPIGSELTNFPSLDLKNLVGRKQELKDVKNLLKQNTMVCITGISGQGKTTLARAYLSKNKNEYSKIIYLETDSSIQSAFLSSDALISNLKLRDEFNELSKTKKDLQTHVNISPKDEDKEKSHFELMMSKLRSLPGDNILVVDNINSFASSELSLLPKENWKILFTSKEKIENGDVSMYSLETLSDIDSIELFKKHCDKEAKDDDLKMLLTMIDYHALLIELTAKAISKSLEINSLQSFLDRIKKDVNDESLTYSFRIDHSKNQEVEFSKYIKQVFSISNIEKENPNAVYVLKMFLCFPSLFIEASEIMELLESETLTKNQIGKSLWFLAEKGWLLSEKESFKMHPVIKLGINTQIQLSYEEYTKLLNRLSKIVSNENSLNFSYAQLGLSLYQFFSSFDVVYKNKLLEVLFKSLEYLIENRKYQESLEYAEILLLNEYKIISVYFYRGEIFAKLNDNIKALEDYNKIIKSMPDEPLFYKSRGDVLYDLEQFERAVEDYTKAIELDALYESAYSSRAYAYSKLKQYEKALEDCNNVIAINHNYPFGYNYRGLIYISLGQIEKAIEDYSKAIELDPTYLRYFNNRGDAYSYLGQTEKAINDYSKAIELDSKYAPSYYNRGIAYYKLKQFEKAVTDFTEGLKLNSNYIGIYYFLGLTFEGLGQIEKAIENYSKAIKQDSTNINAFYNRGLSYSKLGQFEKSLEDYTKTIQINPNYKAIYYNRGVVYSNLGQFEKAIQDFTKEIEIDQKNVGLYNYRGFTYSKMGQYEKAIKDYSEVIELEQKSFYAYNSRGVAYLNLGQLENAISDYSNAIEIEPKNAEAYFNRGFAFFKLSQIDKAIEDFTTVLEIDSKYPKAYLNRGLLYAKRKQRELAIKDFTKALESDSTEAYAYYYRGLNFQRLKQYKKAIEDFSKSIELNSKLLRVHNHRGRAFFKLGQIEKAIDDYSKEIELDPTFGESYYNRGDAFFRLGKVKNAFLDYTKQIELGSLLIISLINKFMKSLFSRMKVSKWWTANRER